MEKVAVYLAPLFISAQMIEEENEKSRRKLAELKRDYAAMEKALADYKKKVGVKNG